MLLPDRQKRNIQNNLDNVRLLNKLFYDTPAYSSAAHHPRMNLWASDQKVVIHALAPGVDKEDIDIQISGQTLFIEFRRQADEDSGQLPGRQDTQSIQLPFPVNCDKVHAKFNDGLLVIELPRLLQTWRKISIKP